MERATISNSRPGPARREGSVTGGTGRGIARRRACRMLGRAAGQQGSRAAGQQGSTRPGGPFPGRALTPGVLPVTGVARSCSPCGCWYPAMITTPGAPAARQPGSPGSAAAIAVVAGAARPPLPPARLAGWGHRARPGRPMPAWPPCGPAVPGSVLLSCRARLAPGQRRGASTDADAGAVSEDDMFFIVRQAPRPRTAWGVPSACKATRTGRRAVKGTVPCPG
jgi:hypothetical protein